MKKILIIRFSSIGDIIQCMSVTQGIKAKFNEYELHWVTRKDMASLLKIDPDIDKIWEYDKKEGLSGLLRLITMLRKQKYTYIYDAHSNIRSNLIYFLFKITLCQSKWITRHKNRIKRILLFQFGINLLPKPFRSIESFQKPLQKWDVSFINLPHKNWEFPQAVHQKVTALMEKDKHKEKTITLVSSAAWDLKRWPVDYWKQLIELLKNYHFIIIGGPTDSFCEEIRQVATDRIINLAGKTTLLESFSVINLSEFVISGDTGFLHAADLFDKQGIALIGPTAFGFTSGNNMNIMEVPLSCRPCTKDGNVKCKNKEYKKCMMDISPAMVAINVFNRF
jgi:heptosyltransferase-2